MRSPARSTSSTCSSAAATRATRAARSSCGTTGWSAAGAAATARTARTRPRPIFGVGLAVQPLEAQERLCPVLTTGHEIRTDSGGPGTLPRRLRRREGSAPAGGGGRRDVLHVRPRPVDHLGNRGGLPSIPHGVWLTRDGERRAFLGAVFSNVPCGAGDEFTRPSAGGGGYGDPLERDPAAVREDVADGYVSIERARKDYGVVVLEVDAELARVRGRRRGNRGRAGADPLRAARLAGGRSRGRRSALPRGRARPARRHPPPRGHPRLGHRRATAPNHRAVSGDASVAHGVALGRRRVGRLKGARLASGRIVDQE